MDKDIDLLLNSETEQLEKLKNIVKKTIEDENLIIENLINPQEDLLARDQKIFDKVARFVEV